jgi:DNA-binding NarL/FixJ family response regulator
LNIGTTAPYIFGMRVLCVSRHPFLSEHLCRFFEALDVSATPCVGVREAIAAVAVHEPDVVICDYDVLATMSLHSWETDPTLSGTPVIAVSLTRHPGEAHLLDTNGISGFLYLPTLDPDDAHRVLAAASRRRDGITPPDVLPWSATKSVEQMR